MKLPLLLFLIFFINLDLLGQDLKVERLFTKDDASVSVYALKIINTSNDSIIVLHAQEAQFPPFINLYKWDEVKSPKRKIILHFGKTADDLNPEKYRATKTLASRETAIVYFSFPSKFDNAVKELELWLSFLDNKYLGEFKKSEVSNSSDAIKKCKTIKEKHGKVVHRFLSF